MDKLSQMKLAIYERYNAEEITKEECNLLLEKAEEKYLFEDCEVGEVLSEEEEITIECVMDGLMTYDEAVDLLDDMDIEFVTEKDLTKSFNKIGKTVHNANQNLGDAFVNTVGETSESITKSIKKNALIKKTTSAAINRYKKEIKEIKGDISNKNFDKAKQRIKFCTAQLKIVKTGINSIHTTPTDDVVAFVSDVATTMLQEMIVIGITNALMKIAKENNYTAFDVSGHLKEITGAAASKAIKDRVKTKTWNGIKSDAIKAVDKQIATLSWLTLKINLLETFIFRKKDK